MTQFCAHRDNTRSSGPLLLDLQNDFAETLSTRVVAPLYPFNQVKGETLSGLTPVVEIQGKRYVAMIPRLAAIRATDLGSNVADLSGYRVQLLSALDLLITGF